MRTAIRNSTKKCGVLPGDWPECMGSLISIGPLKKKCLKFYLSKLFYSTLCTLRNTLNRFDVSVLLSRIESYSLLILQRADDNKDLTRVETSQSWKFLRHDWCTTPIIPSRELFQSWLCLTVKSFLSEILHGKIWQIYILSRTTLEGIW